MTIKPKFFRGTFWRVALAALLVIAAPVAGFTQETTSAIRGKIFDESGNPVVGTNVVVQDMRTGVTRTYTSNDAGVFLASNLPVGGPYRVVVGGTKEVTVDSIALGDAYNLTINMQAAAAIEEIVVVGQAAAMVDVAAGPASTYSSFDLDTAVSFDRDITAVYSLDPRLNLDIDGSSVNCAGQHPRFNSVTMDGVSQNDRFGLNSNGYSTATGMPFPYSGIEQIAVELAPFDVTYGGFSACNINVVSRSGTNEWRSGVFYEYTNDSLRGDTIGGISSKFTSPSYTEDKYGFHVGGPLIQDRLFIFGAYEKTQEPEFIAQGYAGSNNGTERPWLSQADYQRIADIAQDPTKWNYNPGGQPSDGSQENESYMVRVDWNITDKHNAALIYNYFDGFEDRASDDDSDEFEYANHYYQKGATSETTTLKLYSQWTDAFSTELFLSKNTMDDSQVTVGPKDFAEVQISIGNNLVYMGADDSRQANALNTESQYLKLSGQYLTGDHIITAGYEAEKLDIFNQFVQHARGGEIRFFDDSAGNDPACAALTAQERFDDVLGLGCGTSGIDKFELGRPNRYYYGSGGGTNNAADAAASFSSTLHSYYIQDEIYFDRRDLTVIAGFRYDRFTSDDRPNFNPTFTAAHNGLRNDANLDGVDLVMPRLGFTWGITDDLSLRGGIGLFSGGNPNVWISNAWSNDGLTNVQLQYNSTGSSPLLPGVDNPTLFPGQADSIPLIGSGRPGVDVPQAMYDAVAAITPANGSNNFLVIIDPDYKQPRQWKMAFGGTYDLPFWDDASLEFDVMYAKLKEAAYYVDVSQSVIGETILGQPRYGYTNGRDSYMLTNSSQDATMSNIAVSLSKSYDWGLDFRVGYSYTDSEDISPMTSSVAGSNFDNNAVLDINNPGPGTSNYLVPHRFTTRISYGREFFGDNMTRFTLYGIAQEGQPQSYVMTGSGLEGDGRNRRHLLYVPTGPNDPNVIFDPAFDQQAFFDFVAAEGLSPGFQSRNAQHAKWSSRFDLRIDQELPGFFEDLRGKLFVKVYNVGNLLNKDWGKQWDAQFFPIQVVDSTVDSGTGQYVFRTFFGGDLNDLLEQRTLWEARLGIELNFR